jgi:Ser/Thr protein kinase RdoA (MazF antagonist)
MAGQQATLNVHSRYLHEGLVGENPHWGRFWEHGALTGSENRLLQQARQEIHVALCGLGMESSTFSLIHADLNPDNIIYEGGKLALIGWFHQRPEHDEPQYLRALTEDICGKCENLY